MRKTPERTQQSHTHTSAVNSGSSRSSLLILKCSDLAKADASRGRTFRQHLQAAIAEGFNGWSIGRDEARRKGFFIEDSLFPRNPLTKKQFCAFRIRTINWRFAPDDRTVLE